MTLVHPQKVGMRQSGDRPVSQTYVVFMLLQKRVFAENHLLQIQSGSSVINLRFGIILSPKGGALKNMLLPFRFGAGGRVGDGRQYWSWISIDDAAGAIHHALMTDSLSGPVNAVAPNPVTNAEFTKTLGRVLVRPAILPMPAFAARLALGEMADELLLASIRVEPRQLIESGYDFRQPTLESAIRHLLGKPAYPRSDHE